MNQEPPAPNRFPRTALVVAAGLVLLCALNAAEFIAALRGDMPNPIHTYSSAAVIGLLALSLISQLWRAYAKRSQRREASR